MKGPEHSGVLGSQGLFGVFRVVFQNLGSLYILFRTKSRRGAVYAAKSLVYQQLALRRDQEVDSHFQKLGSLTSTRLLLITPPKTPNSQRHVKERVGTTGDKGRQGRRGAQQPGKATQMTGDKGRQGAQEPGNSPLRMWAILK